MRKKIFRLGMLTFLISAFSFTTQASFQMGKDDLCFLNKDPDLAQFGFWGELGVKEGVCQGMAGLSKIFYENVTFDQRRIKNDKANFEAIIEAFKTYRHRPFHKIVISGYAGLNDLCQDFRNTFLRQSIELNRDIGVNDIAPIYPEFNWVQANPITTRYQQMEIDQTVYSHRRFLSTGRYPLILVYSHVMLVTDIQLKASQYIYTYYDSNFHAFQTRAIPYGSDGWPALGQKMIWDITLDN